MQSLQTYSFLIFQEDDYDIITDNYKAEEGSLAERKATIKALRQSGGLWASNRFPASLSQDMFYQMTDLDKGIYGRPYNVSLFLHVSYWPFFKLISKDKFITSSIHLFLFLFNLISESVKREADCTDGYDYIFHVLYRYQSPPHKKGRWRLRNATK